MPEMRFGPLHFSSVDVLMVATFNTAGGVTYGWRVLAVDNKPKTEQTWQSDFEIPLEIRYYRISCFISAWYSGSLYGKVLTGASWVILQVGAISTVVDSLVVVAHQAHWDAFSILAGEVGLTAAFRLIKPWKRMSFALHYSLKYVYMDVLELS